jgi:hypothetical protein
MAKSNRQNTTTTNRPWSTSSSHIMCLLRYHHVSRRRRDWPARGVWTAAALARHAEKKSIFPHGANPTSPPLQLHPRNLMTPDHPELARLGARNHQEGHRGVRVIDPDYLQRYVAPPWASAMVHTDARDAVRILVPSAWTWYAPALAMNHPAEVSYVGI